MKKIYRYNYPKQFTEPKRRSVIVDVDGTVFKNLPGVDWFDYLNPQNDAQTKGYYQRMEVNQAVLTLLVALMQQNIHPIMLTARPARFADLTLESFRRLQIPCCGLYMRPDGDESHDVDLKRGYLSLPEVVRSEIQFVLEDRTCVVEMWRKEGLPCFQVEAANY